MNAVEIEEAVSDLIAQPFDAVEFPFKFLAAFGNKDTTLRRLRSGSSNTSDVPGGVLQRNNIHIAVAPRGTVETTLAALRDSPKTGSSKAKLLLATDGVAVEAEDLLSAETIACEYTELAEHFAFFLPLAGISTVKEIKDNPIDVKATGRLNKLYIELLKDNPDWATAARRHALNQFMARLIFCFFAEDTGIFTSQQFTETIKQMSDGRSDNTHEVLAELFRAMDMNKDERALRKVRSWADRFPYVNGGLFADVTDSPRFSRIARSYLLRAGELNWREINPDIFGSMIQAVADDDERGELGMHYTSVPNILKVLNPLFLDDLRAQLEAAGDNPRKLRNLRKRLSGIRVFDPACGSGNFLVIAYKEMREIEAEIVRRLRDEQKRSMIGLSNFFGIEIKGFAAEIARLALLIAEFQADCLHLSQHEARAMVLPLHRTGQIHVGNALRMDWATICPAVTQAVATKDGVTASARGPAPILDTLSEVSDTETYICGNPPYLGFTWQSPDHKADLESIFADHSSAWKSLDYVAGWFLKAAEYATVSSAESAFVTTNSISQGEQVPILWPLIFARNREIRFAHTSFKWQNLASHNAGVTVAVIGLGARGKIGSRKLFTVDDSGLTAVREVPNINAYLVPSQNVIVHPMSRPLGEKATMLWGNKPTDGGHLCLTTSDKIAIELTNPESSPYFKRLYGAKEFIRGENRWCIWVDDEKLDEAVLVPSFRERFLAVAEFRRNSRAAETRPAASYPHRFRQIQGVGLQSTIIVPSVSSEHRSHLPVGLLGERSVVSNAAFGIYDAPLWNLALIASRLHLVWIATVCGKLKTDFRYSNTLGWNTFPLPHFTAQNKTDLTNCAEEILLAREAHFPASIAQLYDGEAMPADLRRAHQANDEVLERIYIGRRFRNDTERLEKLFELYTALTPRESDLTTRPHKGSNRPKAPAT
jgi:hypothetical protein